VPICCGELRRSTRAKPVQGGHDAHDFDLDVFLAQTGSGRSLARYGERTPVFQQGDVADAIYFIQSGKASIGVVSSDGKQAVLGILGAGEFFGECCLSGHERRLFTATTVTECSLMRLEKDVAIEALNHEPKFASLFLTRILAAKNRVEESLATHIFDNSEVRLAKTLLSLAKFGEHDRPEALIEKLSQETLAQMIGTTRSRVNLFMNKFRRLGYVDYNGDIRVHRSLLNVVLHELPPDDGPDAD
jgi:CRP/FNR family cyclic AMP-dependent transcriptional regulator